MSLAVTEYRESLKQIEQQRREYAERSSRWNLIRTLLFFIAAGLLTTGYLLVPHALLVVLGWTALVGFLVSVSLHEQLRDKMLLMRHRRSVLRRLIARCERNWERLPQWQPKDAEIHQLVRQASGTLPAPDLSAARLPGSDSGGTAAKGDDLAGDAVAVADDLDVFGRGSLFQLVSTASMGPGLRCLAGWLIGPARQRDASARYQAARVLAAQRPWRIEFYCEAKRTASGTADPDRFLAWITSPSWLTRHPLLAIWSMISPLLVITLALGLVVCALLPDVGSGVLNSVAAGLAAVVLVNLLISTFLLGEVHEIFASAISGRGDVAGYQRMFQMPATLPENSGVPLLETIKQTLSDPQHGASVAMDQLGRIAWLASLKQSGGLFLIYLLLQMGGLWDLHILRRLERWKMMHADRASRWFQALGQLEAIASLAALCDENPQWTEPVWTTGQPGDNGAAGQRLEAKQLGHPLLKDSVRVCNDVAVGPQGTLLLVTGSNMSGKSTLLRSLGLNALLAGAGGPVCAQAFSLPDLELATSIRVRDNLGEGVSFYMAELKSLARVVKHAEALSQRRQATTPDPSDTMLLYLLDEILQGTNSRERQIAVAHVLRHLIDHGAIGAISTHDLELADDPQLQAIAQTVHFRETITCDADGRDQMTFDYQMRHGVSPTTNALRLLEVVGLGKP